MSDTKRNLPSNPDRYMMIKAAILMERSGFNFNEWTIMARLCDSAYPIRQYILSFAEECLEAFEGLAPTRAHYAYEIAAIAANNVYKKAIAEMPRFSGERIARLMEPPAPWTQEEAARHRAEYYKRHPDSYRVTARLKETLKQEAAAVYHERYKTPTGCTIIPFEPREVRHAKTN